MNSKRDRKFNLFWGNIVIMLSNIYFYWKVNIGVLKNDTKGLKPPYLILANYVTYWNPFLVNIFVKGLMY